MRRQPPAFDGILFLQGVSERVVETTDGILNLAFGLIGLTFNLQLGVTYGFADGLSE
jgi:hypothetical protein